MRKALRATLFAAAFLLPGGALAQLGSDTGADRIVAAREALRKGDRGTLERLASVREPHVLDAYPRYWLLTNRLAGSEPPPAGQLEAFLTEEAGSNLAERLRADWLRRMAKDGDWAGFRRLYPDLQNPDEELRCSAWTARILGGDRSALDEVAQQWDSLTEAYPACDLALASAASGGLVDEDQVWQRIRRQVDTRKPASALDSLSLLPPGSAPSRADLDQAIRSPAPWLDRLPANFAITRAGRELALVALVRLAREDIPAAQLRLLRIQDRLGADERNYANLVLAMHAAIDRLPEARALYAAAGDIRMTPLQRAWRVRAALRAQDWRGVRSAIEAMPADEREQPDWIYWLGRAHAATGNRDAADSLFVRIAAEPHFYGMLAAEELGQPFMPPPATAPLPRAKLEEAERDPSLRRALALYQLDMRTEAIREWVWGVRGRDEQFRLGAAHLALRNELYDRAINTAELANPRSNFELRFLTPYRDLIEPQVRAQGLDLGWVYGLMRQESRFVIPARSSVGARGLMQVMPATGKWVANKIGLAGYNHGLLNDPDTNVLLGTSYMRIILEDLDAHPVLASAGYNAGPGRARRWRDAQPLEGAIYAETIPFDETRDYVKKVLANAVIYSAMLEKRPQSLKARLGTIAPAPTRE
ncbi:MAG TPA: transglycosylase [Thauera sp.]|nr:transglycosylase [Thauera sp.]HHW62703.1 lytic transglycosylase domain-containing protein [Rhodocyclaceae bacterium]